MKSIPFRTELRQSTRIYTQRIEHVASYASTTDAEATAGVSANGWSAKFVPWLRIESPNDVGGAGHDSKFYLEAKEAWLEALHDDWDVRIGNQILAWGSSDAFNPTDVWNATDFTDPFEPTKLPLAAIRLAIHPLASAHIILEAIASPQFRPHRLPISLSRDVHQSIEVKSRDSRWLLPTPNLFRLSETDTVPITYHVTGAQAPSAWQTGARLRVIRVKNWDYAFSVSETTLQMPAFSTKIAGDINIPSLPIDITLKPVFYRVATFGLDASGTVGPMGVRLDLAQRRALRVGNAAIPNKTYLGTLGADYSHSLGKSELYINLLFIFKDTPGHSTEPTTLGVPEFEPWDRNLALVLEDRISKNFNIGMRAVTSLKHQDGLISPYCNYLFYQNTKAELGMDLFVGAQSGAFGQYRDNNRVRTVITTNF